MSNYIADKYQRIDYMNQYQNLLNLRTKIIYLQQDLRIFKEDPAMNREREKLIQEARDHIFPMKIAIEKILNILKEELDKYDELQKELIKNNKKLL